MLLSLYCHDHPLPSIDTQAGASLPLLSFQLSHLALALELPAQDVLTGQDRRFLVRFEHFHFSFFYLAEKGYPVLNAFFFKFYCFPPDEFSAGLADSKERAYFMPLNVLGLKQGTQLLNESSDVLLNLSISLGDCDVLDKGTLASTFEATLPELAFPFPPEPIPKLPKTMHEVVFPLPLVPGPVCEVENALAVMLVAGPFAIVLGSVRVVVGSKALHLVLAPVSLVGLRGEVGGGGNDCFAIAVLHLFAFEEVPVALVQNSIEVLEPTVA